MSDPVGITIEYIAPSSGRLGVATEDAIAPIWLRIRSLVVSTDSQSTITDTSIKLPWPNILNIVRELGSKATQRTFNFRFRPDESAAKHLHNFTVQVQRVRECQQSSSLAVTPDDIEDRLQAMGFTRRKLKPFQLHDLSRLVALPNGANFSVPGAGKTTVTFALHLLVRSAGQQLFVVGPKRL